MCSGYMSPEYAMKGIFSVKSDVFSFGVLLLEIVTGRKNTVFTSSTPVGLIEQVCGSNFRHIRLFHSQIRCKF